MLPELHGKPFRFKQFDVYQSRSAMRVGTDGVLLGAWANVEAEKHILDVGCGTGVIALICAQKNSNALIEAIEMDEGSAEDAKLNFEISQWSNRLKVYRGDFLKISTGEKFDHIISNPPYFTQSLRAANPIRSTARHDDALPAEAFMEKCKSVLLPEGKVSLIFPTSELKRWSFAAQAAGFFPRKVCHVFTRPYKESSRVLVQFSRGAEPEPLMESLLIEKSPGEFSEAYRNLTFELYSKWASPQ